MHLFSYLYIAAAVILWLLKIKVMILNTFLQLQNQEILYKYLTTVGILIKNPLETILTDGTLTTTGTAGTTITLGITETMAGINLISIGTITVLFIIAHLLDRRLNRKLDQELMNLDQDQDQDLDQEQHHNRD